MLLPLSRLQAGFVSEPVTLTTGCGSLRAQVGIWAVGLVLLHALAVQLDIRRHHQRHGPGALL